MKLQQCQRLVIVALLTSLLGAGCGGGGKDDPTSVALRPPKVQPQDVVEGGGSGDTPSEKTGEGY
ncbi:MAG: hypothetical protein KDA84_30525, partial [Planctomycetaceae bacterium]|nr:hypothetical protein [Planctomycetaceae bacterium]